MAREAFIERRFSAGSLDMIEKANVVLEEYESQGLVLTLRQLYYQFVARDLFPADRRWRLVGNNKWVRDKNGTPNATPNYKWLGMILNDARLAGLVDWSMMEDRTRVLQRITHWEAPSNILEAVADQYKEDLWRDQQYRPEVWIEKDALIGVIERACTELRVDYFACRGYASQSAQYEAGHRFRRYLETGQTPVVFHLGDHDPSGIDMTRDNETRLTMFALMGVEVRRLALNMDQVRQFSPPPNPAKETDSRASDYIDRFGHESWELDALEPTVIDRLIRVNVRALINRRKWTAAKKQEDDNRKALRATSDQWDDVREFVNSQEPS